MTSGETASERVKTRQRNSLRLSTETTRTFYITQQPPSRCFSRPFPLCLFTQFFWARTNDETVKEAESVATRASGNLL